MSLMREQVNSVRYKLLSVWKWTLSFFKRDWTLDDYPVAVRKQDIVPDPLGRFTQHTYQARILNWNIVGSGETHRGALRSLDDNLTAAKKKRALSGTKPARPGVNVPIEFASDERIETHRSLSEHFIQHILEVDWAWISDESSLWDFHAERSSDVLIAKIQQVYGVDVSDVPSGNLAQILERIAAAAPHT